MNKNTKYFGYEIQIITHSCTGGRLKQFAGLTGVIKQTEKNNELFQ